VTERDSSVYKVKLAFSNGAKVRGVV